jgi:hypothetical protein
MPLVTLLHEGEVAELVILCKKMIAAEKVLLQTHGKVRMLIKLAAIIRIDSYAKREWGE